MMKTYANGTAALKMPRNYVSLTEEEMTYVDGGYQIQQSRDFLRKAYCLGYATNLKSKLHWNNISTADLAAELYAHAVVWYSPITKVGDLVGLSFAKSFRSSAQVIDVENKPDSRAWAFRIIYACYPDFSR